MNREVRSSASMIQLVVILLTLLTLSAKGQQWRSFYNSGYSGYVYSLGSDGNQLFAGTAHGVYKANLKDGAWKAYNSGLAAPFIEQQTNCFLTDGGKIFAGVNGGLYTATLPSGAWNLVGAKLVSGLPSFSSISAIIKFGSNYFLGTEGYGIFISKDQGQTWSSSSSGLSSTPYIRSLHAVGNVLYAGTQNSEIFQSTDNGSSWTAVSTGLPLGNNAVQCFANLSTLTFAGTDIGVFTSSNQGALWTSANHGLPPNSNITSLLTVGSTVFAGLLNAGVYSSTDQGATWTYSGLSNVYSLLSVNNVLYAGTPQGVYNSSDGGVTWNPFGSQLTNIAVNSIVVKNDSIFVGGDSGIFFSTNDSIWTRFTKEQNSSLVSSGKDLLYSTGLTVNYLANNGSSWKDSPHSLTSIYSLFAHNDTILGGSVNAIYRSTNKAAAWVETDNGISPGYAVSSFTKSGSKILVGTNNGIYSSTDRGTTWVNSSNLLPKNTQVLGLFTLGKGIYAGAYYGLYLSEDNGGSWFNVTTGLPPLYALCVYSMASSQGLLFAGTNSGVNYSKDGTSWLPIPGLDSIKVYSLSIWNDKLLAGTNNWIYSIKLSDLFPPVTGLTVENSEVHVYPNPSSKNLYVKGLSESTTEFKIIDQKGQSTNPVIYSTNEVSTIDISSYESGVYILLIFEGKRILSYKFIKY
ncbi:MAG: T9SS type A sorting domain-containing protein [Bacteroidetes bacterium]|nr:T9SS type A sorting domain-containing protein [Bacteroidota bacterium]